MVDFLMTMWRRIIHYENRKMSLMKYVRILILKRGEWNVVTFDEYEMLICVWNKNGVKKFERKIYVSGNEINMQMFCGEEENRMNYKK